MKRTLLSAVLALALLAGAAAPALADATITISGGPLSVTPQAIAFTAVTLNGAAQTSNGTTTAWTTTDPTGTGAGWHLNIKATNFSDGAGHTIAVTGFQLTLSGAGITTVAGNTQPTSQMTTATALSTTDQSLVTAAVNAGMGTYSLLPTFTLSVPADTYAGAYTSTVTLTMVAGP